MLYSSYLFIYLYVKSSIYSFDSTRNEGGIAGGDLKSRLLAKKKAAEGAAGSPSGGPPLAPPRSTSPGCITRLPYQLRASAELNADSDEDN